MIPRPALIVVLAGLTVGAACGSGAVTRTTTVPPPVSPAPVVSRAPEGSGLPPATPGVSGPSVVETPSSPGSGDPAPITSIEVERIEHELDEIDKTLRDLESDLAAD